MVSLKFFLQNWDIAVLTTAAAVIVLHLGWGIFRKRSRRHRHRHARMSRDDRMRRYLGK